MSSTYSVSEKQFNDSRRDVVSQAKERPVVINNEDEPLVLLSLKGLTEQEKDVFLQTRSPSKLERKIRKILHSFML